AAARPPLPFPAAWPPRSLFCGVVEDAPADLVLLDRFEQRLEVALAEALVALPLDELEEDRADHGLREDLQQDLRHAAVHHALAVDEDAVLPQPLDRLLVAMHALVRLLVIGVRRAGHEFQAVLGQPVGGT